MHGCTCVFLIMFLFSYCAVSFNRALSYWNRFFYSLVRMKTRHVRFDFCVSCRLFVLCIYFVAIVIMYVYVQCVYALHNVYLFIYVCVYYLYIMCAFVCMCFFYQMKWYLGGQTINYLLYMQLCISIKYIICISDLFAALFFGLVAIGMSYLAPHMGDNLIQVCLSIFGTAGGPLFGVFVLAIFFPCCNSAVSVHHVVLIMGACSRGGGGGGQV